MANWHYSPNDRRRVNMAKIVDDGKFVKKNSKLVPAKNAERERSRVKSLRNAFQTLQSCLPSVPPDTKLSKLDILILATNYISILMQTLDNNTQPTDYQPFYPSPDNYINQHQHFTNENGFENFETYTNVYRPIKVK